MGAAILENMPVTRSEDSTLFREISREIFAVRVGRTATCVGFREISREMLWPTGADPGKLQGEGHESKWCPYLYPKIKNSTDFRPLNFGGALFSVFFLFFIFFIF